MAQTKDEELQAILSKHLNATLDNFESESPELIPEDHFFDSYYHELCGVTSKLKSTLSVFERRPVLLLGRAGTGKTTVLTGVLRDVFASVGIPYVRVAIHSVMDHSKSEYQNELHQLIRKTLREKLLQTCGTLVKCWKLYFDSIHAGTSKALDLDDLVEAAYEEYIECKLNATLPKNVLSRLLLNLNTRSSINSLLRMSAFVLSGGRSAYINLLIDNVENPQSIEFANTLINDLRDLVDDVHEARIVLSMRYSTVRMLRYYRKSSVLGNNELNADRAEERTMSIGSVSYSLFEVEAEAAISSEEFLADVQAIVLRRLERLDRSIPMVMELGRIARDRRVMIDICKFANHNLRDTFTILINVVNFQFSITDGREEAFSLDPRSGMLVNESDQERKLDTEPRDLLASIFYFMVGSGGSEKLLRRPLRESDPAGRISKVLIDPMSIAEKSINSEVLDSSVIGDDSAMKCRIVFGSCVQSTGAHGRIDLSQATCYVGDVFFEVEKYGLSRRSAASIILGLCGDGGRTNFIEIEGEESGLKEEDLSSLLIRMQPRGLQIYNKLCFRYQFWAGLVSRRPDYGFYPQIQKRGNPAERSALLALLVFSAQVRMFEIEIMWLIRRAIFESARDYLGEDGPTVRFRQLMEGYGRLQGPNNFQEVRGALLSLRCLSSFGSYWGFTYHRTGSKYADYLDKVLIRTVRRLSDCQELAEGESLANLQTKVRSATMKCGADIAHTRERIRYIAMS